MEEENYLDIITRQITEKINPRRLVLFGSRASGKVTPDSDIDLCVIEDSISDKSAEVMRVNKVLQNIFLPMDILVFSQAEFDKRKNIWGTVQFEVEKKGKILYERRD